MISSSYEHATLEWGNETISFSNQEHNPYTKHILTDLKGWYGGVGTRGEESERMGHGNYKSRKYRAPRSITLEATLNFNSELNRKNASRFVSGILGDGNHGLLTVTSGDLTLHTEVVLDGEIGHGFHGTNAIKIQIPLLAQDPLLYGPTKTYQLFPAGVGTGLVYPLFSGGQLDYGTGGAKQSVLVTNEGNFEATPRFITANNFPSGIRVSDGQGKAVEVRMPIFAQSPVSINMSGSVMRNGHDFSSLLTSRQWFTVGPGETIQPTVESLQEGDGWVNIEISDTYI